MVYIGSNCFGRIRVSSPNVFFQIMNSFEFAVAH